MDLISISGVKNLLKKSGLRPDKRFGQNFLVDSRALEQIIRAADLKPEDTVLEIGPGLGVLTRELAKRAGKVVAVEKDPKMCEILRETLKEYKNVEIIQGDILKLNTKYQLQNTKYKVVANLPYYVASPVIRKFLESRQAQPGGMVLTVQKEVGQRICAKPPKMNLLAVSIQLYAKPEIVSYVPKTSFWPSPKVDAAIVRITPKKLAAQFDKDLFFRIVKAGFSQPRKQLLNNLSRQLKIDRKNVQIWLSKNGIKPVQRAETLSIDDWLNLTNSFSLLTKWDKK